MTHRISGVRAVRSQEQGSDAPGPMASGAQPTDVLLSPTIDFRSPATPLPAAVDALSIPGYRLLGRLGGGGMGHVFLASQLFAAPDDALRTVAIKTIRPELLASDHHRRIMENDIRIAATLDHPHIVRILQVGPAEGTLFYTMPYLKGGSLAERIDRVALPASEAAEILLRIAEAVEYLHTQPTPIVHLDLKPANILLDDHGTPYLADFGLARLVQAADDPRVTQSPAGTPEYMAPEQFEGWVSPACDVYGLGAILYKLLTGHAPCPYATWRKAMRVTRDHTPPPPRHYDGAIDRGLEAICMKCIEKDPQQRYADAGALAHDLRRYLVGEAPDALKVHWTDWLRRQLGREIVFDAAAAWAKPLAWQGVLSLPAYLCVYGLLWLEAPAALYWLWLLAALPLAAWGPWVWLRSARSYGPREREILLLWVTVGVAKAILFGLNCPLRGAIVEEDILQFFPASMAVNGLMLCLEGRLYWGRLYLIGLLDFLAAIVMSFCLPVAPLLFTLWNSTVLIAMAMQMRRHHPNSASAASMPTANTDVT